MALNILFPAKDYCNRNSKTTIDRSNGIINNKKYEEEEEEEEEDEEEEEQEQEQEQEGEEEEEEETEK